MSTAQHDGDPARSPWNRPADPTDDAEVPAAGAAGSQPGRGPEPDPHATTGQPEQPQPFQPGYAAQPYPGWPDQPEHPGYPAQPAYPPPGYAPWPYPVVARTTNGLAIASLACAAAGIAFCGVPALVGAILGHVARGQIRRTGQDGAGLALAGIITGWAVFGLTLVSAAAYIGLVGWFVTHAPMDGGGFPTPEPVPS